MLNSISAVQAQQAQLQAQTAQLQASVDQANVLAQAQARDPTLVNLIDQGRQDISSNQVRAHACMLCSPLSHLSSPPHLHLTTRFA